MTGTLDSPQLGHRSGRTLVGFVVLSVLTAGLLSAEFVPRVVDDEGRFLLWVLNGFAGVVLFSVLLAPVFGVTYGLWNGGPVLAAAVPTVPVLVGHMIAAQPVATADLSFALAGGGAAAVVGAVQTVRLSDGDGRAVRASLVGLAIAIATTVMAGVFLWRLLVTAGPHVTVGLWSTGALLALTLGGLAVFAVVAGPRE